MHERSYPAMERVTLRLAATIAPAGNFRLHVVFALAEHGHTRTPWHMAH